MSLINQMLRDLKVRKEADERGKAIPLRAKVAERIPYLPLPLVFGGSALLLVFLLWWLAGALSDALFRFESVPGQVAGDPAVQRVADVPTATPVEITAERETLTPEERAAEPASAPVVATGPVVLSTPVTRPEKVVARQPEPASPVRAVPARPVAEPDPAVRLAAAPDGRPATQSKVIVKPAPPTKPAAEEQRLEERRRAVARKLHPDNLPGAILSTSREFPSRRPVESAVVALPTSPYGVAEQFYLDGKWARDQQRPVLATRSLEDALEAYPGHLPARTLLVELFVQEGNTGEAMFLLAEGLDIAPDYLPFKKQYARLLTEQGDYAVAAKVLLADGLPAVDEDPESHILLASVYQRLGEPFLAAQTYRNLLVAWPQTGAFWVGLGGALEAQRLPDEAMECYRRALATDNLRQDLNTFATRRLGQLN